MLKILLDGKKLNVLFLGAHSDDIEIGCGGTVLKLIENEYIGEVKWLVFSSDQRREAEARKSAQQFLRQAKKKDIVIKNYRDGFLPYSGSEVKDLFENLKTEFSPDLIFTHYRHDLHQDHRLICELTWNTWRDHLVLEYEIPKYDGDMGVPNFFVPLEKKTVDQKIDIILDNFLSQRKRHWFDRETFSSIMRLRGMESASESGYAEAFYAPKIVL